MKRIILEYSSLPLFGSFNRRNGKFIPVFGSLKVRVVEGAENWEDRKWCGDGKMRG